MEGERLNYIRELNAFYDWLESNPCSTGVIALWHALMAINNRTGWEKEFTVANMTLQLKTGLSRKQLERCRNFLIQKGRIRYEKSNRVNQAGKYSIVTFDAQNDTRYDTQQDAHGDTRYDAQNVLRMTHEASTLVKQNKTKQNSNDDDVARVAQAFEQIFGRFMNSIQQQDLLEYMDKGMEVDLIIRDMEKAARNNKPFNYALSIIKNQYNEGIRTVAQAEKEEAERQAAATVRLDYQVESRKGGKTNGTHRQSTESDDDWQRIEENFFK